MKIVFIGAGWMAATYADSLRKLGHPIAAVCDIDAEQAGRMAAQEQAVAYAEHREMLRCEKPDVVFTCIPPGSHTTQIPDAAEAGAAVFTAKPVALDLATAQRAQDAIQKAGVINQVGYMVRYSDIALKAHELIGARHLAMGFGRFLCRMDAGHPWWGKAAMSGGQMLEQSTHVFDLLRDFIGTVESVQAWGVERGANGIADFEECTVCNLRFESGAVGSVVSTCVASVAGGFGAELIGDALYLKLNISEDRLTGRIGDEPVDYTGVEKGYHREVAAFIRAVATGDQGCVRSDYADGVKTLAVTVAANRSLMSGKVEPVGE